MRIERVVVNASPLICLGKSGMTEILPALFNEIIVPAAVHKEITAKDDIEQACRSLFAHRHVIIASDIVIPPAVQSWDLGEGEGAVLAHSLKHSVYWAIVDDREARKCAATLGFRCTGTVGVILLAKKRGIVTSVEDCLVRLQHAGLWIAQELIEQVCRKAGER